MVNSWWENSKERSIMEDIGRKRQIQKYFIQNSCNMINCDQRCTRYDITQMTSYKFNNKMNEIFKNEHTVRQVIMHEFLFTHKIGHVFTSFILRPQSLAKINSVAKMISISQAYCGNECNDKNTVVSDTAVTEIVILQSERPRTNIK